jgi:hypothetical protein
MTPFENINKAEFTQGDSLTQHQSSRKVTSQKITTTSSRNVTTFSQFHHQTKDINKKQINGTNDATIFFSK